MAFFNSEEQSSERVHVDSDEVLTYGMSGLQGRYEEQKVHPKTRKPKLKYLVLLFAVLTLIISLISVPILFPRTESTPIHHPAPIIHKVISKPEHPQQPVDSLLGAKAFIADDAPISTTNKGSCWIRYGGQVTVTASQGDTLTVSYKSPVTKDQFSSGSCPNGIYYTLARSTFLDLNSRYQAKNEAIKKDKEQIQQQLAKGIYGDTQNAGTARWITVVNLQPVYQTNSSTPFDYGNRCIIGHADDGSSQGGSIQFRGKTSDNRTLYQYIPSGNPVDTECPAGTLLELP